MKLLIDMNLSPRWAVVLGQAGHEAVHWSDVGKANARDFEIMGFARENGFVVFSHDLDFSESLRQQTVESPASYRCDPRM
jgi:predicted nuclease of predicted toxin-antitoxin system